MLEAKNPIGFKKPWFQVRVQCVQTLRAVFQVQEQKVAVAFIHNLAPHLIQTLHKLASNKNELLKESQVAIEGLKTLETLLLIANAQKREYKTHMFLFSHLVKNAS
jgi:hypothetical protein